MFKIKTLTQLIKVSMVLNRKLILWLAIGLGLLFILTANTGPTLAPLYWIALFAGGILISSSAFKELHETGNRIHYLTLPCSSFSRYLSVWLLTGPLYFIFITSLYGVGVLAHVLSKNFWAFGDPLSVFWTGGQYLIANTLFLLGAVFFKKLPLIKTLFILLLLYIAWVILEGTLKINLSESVQNGLALALGLLAWHGAYFQLKKTELK
ncbi:MAG: hypothetical protein NTV32_02365 [Gammaproteobacteria bacterium]|nr:hypothetical protein [Gammaproteobacteria bacterium]